MTLIVLLLKYEQIIAKLLIYYNIKNETLNL